LIQTGGSSILVDDPLYQSNNAIQVNSDNFDRGSRDGRENVTVSFWIKTAINDATVRSIIEQYGASGFGPYGWRVQLIDGKIRLRSKFTNGGTDFKEVILESQIIADDKWHHITFSARRQQQPGFVSYGYLNRLYVDQVQVDTGVDYTNGANSFLNSSTSTNPTFNHTVTISDMVNVNSHSIDNIRVYNRDLTGSEIKDLYKEFFSTLSRFYVNQNATGTGMGNTWANAFTDLQKGLIVIDNQEVWVAAGIYKPHVNDRTMTFDISTPNVSIYGGFVGNENQLSDRILGSNETVLSGDLLDNDVNIDNFPDNYANPTRNIDNSYNVFKILNGGENLLLDGLTFSDAHNNFSSTATGGAIVKFNRINQLTLVNCIIKDNVSRNENAGLLAEFFIVGAPTSRASLSIDNCKFINNMSRGGSGIYSRVRSNSYLDITVSNSLFDGNLVSDLNTTSATGVSGSASWFRSTATSGVDVSLKLINNLYVNNIDLGTGLNLNTSNRATVAISKFNSTTFNYVYNAQVSNCIFWDNTTTGGVPTEAITDHFETPISSLVVSNSLGALGFMDSSITSELNNITTNPFFNDAVNGDFTLMSNSPAIDSGDNGLVTSSIDLNGNPRIFNTTVDMGAYEYNSTLGTASFEVVQNEIKLYPNPTNSFLNIEMSGSLKQATIYSVLGTQVLKTTLKTINTAPLTSGMYLIKIENENGLIATKRFVKI